MNFNYFIPSKIIFGCGSLNQLGDQVLPGKKAMIVISSGKSTRANGYLDRVEKELERAGVESIVFDKILPNPILTHVMEGGALAKAEKVDFVVGLGGGSSIDAAKAIAVMVTNDGDYWDYVGGGSGKGMPVKNDPLPIIAITTTAGTGTEADPWTVTTKEDTCEKIGFGYDKTFPVLSIVDPELMATVPAHLTAYQGFDALFHSTEGYINSTANVMSDMYALESIRRIGRSLAKAVENGNDMETRMDVALGNTLAGMVESTSGCTSEHSIEHAMSAFHSNVTHGAGLISISKAYYTFMAENHACDSRMVDMAKALGKEDASEPMDFVTVLVDLQKACHVDDLKMSDWGITYDELEEIAKNARHTMGGLFSVDPIPVSHEATVKILQDSYK